jgi:hypothetical protein
VQVPRLWRLKDTEPRRCINRAEVTPHALNGTASQYEVTDKRNTQGPDGSRTPVFKPIMLAKILLKCSGFKCDNYMKK